MDYNDLSSPMSYSIRSSYIPSESIIQNFNNTEKHFYSNKNYKDNKNLSMSTFNYKFTQDNQLFSPNFTKKEISISHDYIRYFL